jgi:hypothetical protein
MIERSDARGGGGGVEYLSGFGLLVCIYGFPRRITRDELADEFAGTDINNLNGRGFGHASMLRKIVRRQKGRNLCFYHQRFSCSRTYYPQHEVVFGQPSLIPGPIFVLLAYGRLAIKQCRCSRIVVTIVRAGGLGTRLVRHWMGHNRDSALGTRLVCHCVGPLPLGWHNRDSALSTRLVRHCWHNRDSKVAECHRNRCGL